MTLNPGFKVTVYLQVEYLADGARVFNCTKHSCSSLGALPKPCKNKFGVVAEIFFARIAGRCFTPVITVSYGSAYTVVRTMQQVNGNGNFGVSENSVTPEPID